MKISKKKLQTMIKEEIGTALQEQLEGEFGLIYNLARKAIAQSNDLAKTIQEIFEVYVKLNPEMATGLESDLTPPAFMARHVKDIIEYLEDLIDEHGGQ